MLGELDSIQDPLKEKLVELVRSLSEAESDLETVNMMIKKKDAALETLSNSKKEVDEVIDVMRIELDVLQKKKEVEVVKLQESVDHLIKMNELLKTEEGSILRLWLIRHALLLSKISSRIQLGQTD